MPPFNSTQLSILKGMPGLDDEDEASSAQDMEGQPNAANSEEAGENDSSNSQAAPSGEEASPSKVTEGNEGQPSGNSAVGTGDSKPAQTTPQAVTQPVRADGLVAVADPSNPKVSNLVDPRTGQVVVAAGKERRFYDSYIKATREAETTRGRLQQVETELAAYRQANQAAQQYQLAPNEQVDAMRLMSDFKKNPAATIEKIINEVLATGIDLPFLQSGSLSPTVIEGIIDRKLQPIVSPAQQAQAEAQAAAEAKKTLDTFLEDNDNAVVHLPLIAEMIRSDPTLTLERAHNRILRFALENGLDYSRSLLEQTGNNSQATGANNPRPTPTPPASAANNPNPTRPLPNGRSAQAAVADMDDVAEFGGKDDWETILRASMRQAGIGQR